MHWPTPKIRKLFDLDRYEREKTIYSCLVSYMTGNRSLSFLSSSFSNIIQFSPFIHETLARNALTSREARKVRVDNFYTKGEYKIEDLTWVLMYYWIY